MTNYSHPAFRNDCIIIWSSFGHTSCRILHLLFCEAINKVLDVVEMVSIQPSFYLKINEGEINGIDSGVWSPWFLNLFSQWCLPKKTDPWGIYFPLAVLPYPRLCSLNPNPRDEEDERQIHFTSRKLLHIFKCFILIRAVVYGGLLFWGQIWISGSLVLKLNLFIYVSFRYFWRKKLSSDDHEH